MSKEIELTKGYVAIVDNEDYEELNKYSWCVSLNSNGKHPRPARVSYHNGGRKKIYMYRQIMGVVNNPEIEIDHINGDPLDNRKDNLRKCTHLQNAKNMKADKGRRFKGVYKFKRYGVHTGQYRARIRNGDKLEHLGLFDSAEQAAKAYNNRAKELHGEFASLNKID